MAAMTSERIPQSTGGSEDASQDLDERFPSNVGSLQLIIEKVSSSRSGRVRGKGDLSKDASTTSSAGSRALHRFNKP